MSAEDDSSVVYCKSCREQLHPPTARYCSNCGDPQQEIEKRPCILCQYPLPTTSQECILCSAPQDPQMFHQTDKKKCTNPECRVQLIMTSSKCYNCTMDQPHQQHLSYNQNQLKWPWDPMKGNPDQMIAVTFHALLPVSLWEFNDKSDEVYIRFGSDTLGKHQCNVGPMNVTKYVIKLLTI